MSYEIISESEYASLPEGDEEKFIALEGICRQNMNRMVNEETSANFDTSVRLHYMATVSAAAQELGFGEFEFPEYSGNFDYHEFENFSLKVKGLVTRLRLRKGANINSASVRLASKTRGRIEQQVHILRTIVREAEMPAEQRASVLGKLDELSLELSQQRVSFAKVMTALALVSVGVMQAAGFLADAPLAIATITSLLGTDKKAEDEEAQRLGPPPRPKALPAPQPLLSQSSALDDEIPF